MSKGKEIGFAVLVGLISSVFYGVIHDQITIRICPEYFTVWHPHLVYTDNLTLLALAWGVVATWWMGAFLGLMMGLASAIGPLPMAPRSVIVKANLVVMAISGTMATLAGFVASRLHLTFPSSIEGSNIGLMGNEVRHRFAIDLAIHNTSYMVGAFAAFAACIAIVLVRCRMNQTISTVHR